MTSGIAFKSAIASETEAAWVGNSLISELTQLRSHTPREDLPIMAQIYQERITKANQQRQELRDQRVAHRDIKPPPPATVIYLVGYCYLSTLPQTAPIELPSNYKTELCWHFYRSNQCKLGDRCLFAHGERELRINNYKTELCKKHLQKRICPYGPNCRFAHGPHELRKPSEKKNHSFRVISHQKFKTKLCTNFQETGTCEYRSYCQFAHGYAELRA